MLLQGMFSNGQGGQTISLRKLYDEDDDDYETVLGE